jgi:hypothetical protein
LPHTTADGGWAHGIVCQSPVRTFAAVLMFLAFLAPHTIDTCWSWEVHPSVPTVQKTMPPRPFLHWHRHSCTCRQLAGLDHLTVSWFLVVCNP